MSRLLPDPVGFKEPLYRLEPIAFDTYGPQVVSLCRQIGYVPDPEQEVILNAIFAVNEDDTAAAFEIANIAPRQNMKALSVDTPLLTTDGWKTMGTVQVGDEVMSPNGKPTTVIGKSDVKLGHTVYRVTLTDGRSLLADAGHLWTVYDRTRERTVTETTEQLLSRGVVGARPKDFKYRLPRQYGLQLPKQPLEIDPYVLGAWLGDGFSRSGHICAGAEDIAHLRNEMAKAGYSCAESMSRAVHVLRIDGLTKKLRAAELLLNKHVPDQYLRGSAEQRLALLQGLLDTGGTISSAGQVSFVSARRPLAEAVVFLVRSLGWRASLIERRARLHGQDKGPTWWVSFSPSVGEPVPFRMARKAAKIKAGRTDSRFSVSIRDITEVESVPVQCIKVASPDGLFLAGRDLIPTHNTGLGKMAALGWMFVTKEEVVTWSAHLFPTTAETFKDLSNLILNSPVLRRYMAAGRTNGVHGARGSEGLELKDGREMRFRARTNTGARGLTGDKLILDEAFALRDEHMGSVLPTLTAVPDPQILYLSSAGMVQSDILRDIRDRGRNGEDPRLAYFEWMSKHEPCYRIDPDSGSLMVDKACQHIKPGKPGWNKHCALDRVELWKQANTLLGRTRSNGTGLTLEKMRAFRRAEPVGEWMRERLGWWEDPGQDDVFGGNWKDCIGEVPPEPPLALGVAMSYDLTRCAIVGATGSRQEPAFKVLRTGLGQDWVIPKLTSLKAQYPHLQIIIDPVGPAASILRDIKLHDKRYDVKQPLNPTEISTNGALDACSDVYKAVIEHRLIHEDDPELNEAVKSAVRRDVRDRWLWGRKQSSADISSLEAATYAIWALSEEPAESAYERGGVESV